ncbi:DUF2236 domain-containing protein [Sphingomonas crocodyli]|uniref:DUF2236 domain-containing protein n=2 Tax=Sphingomonas crocodyli TaxID=1979270 RepID=A0A437MBS5_9SPHN|nr:DUF2236 domain-containing protein [Sphingomonas crocodyli]
MGTERRWRRFGEPVPAGAPTGPDGAPDYGLFGPGSVAWDVLLHPAVIVLESIGQSLMQLTYKPIAAGIRDHDPLSRKARDGTLTYFDAFERFQRNSGMHAPMWLGDGATARKMADHLHRVHKRVAGDVIDIGAPDLGGYAAAEPREAMWAALTEMHPILRMYEAFAFRGFWLPRRLPKAKRDQYVREVGAYLRLVGAPEAEIPQDMAQLRALYRKYDHLFGHSDTIDTIPATGQNFPQLSAETMKRNFHKTQVRAILPLMIQFAMFKLPILGALPAKARHNAGLGPVKSAVAVAARYLAMPLFWLLQQGPFERRLMRLMWGPDGVALIDNARRLHKQAKQVR